MNNDQKYPDVELVEWDQYPDYIRMDTTKNDEWYIYQFGYLKRYLKRVIEGWSIKDFFKETAPDRIALYAETVFTDIIAEDLRRTTGKIVYASDKKVKKEKNDECICLISPAILFEKYKKREICKVIVCGMFHENLIIDDLLATGFQIDDVITLTSILLQV